MKQRQRTKTGGWLVTALLLVLLIVVPQAMAETPERISLAAAHQALLGDEAVTFIDTRNAGDWQQAKTWIPGAIRVYTQDDLQRVIKELPKDRLIIPYCT